ncbi:hypothetical protein B0H11DRAFT_1920726 [Mycena galericulata]|nr:hypothetical protein B0H11DRAFT_1920726 [Mycena galericulata]
MAPTGYFFWRPVNYTALIGFCRRQLWNCGQEPMVSTRIQWLIILFFSQWNPLDTIGFQWWAIAMSRTIFKCIGSPFHPTQCVARIFGNFGVNTIIYIRLGTPRTSENHWEPLGSLFEWHTKAFNTHWSTSGGIQWCTMKYGGIQWRFRHGGPVKADGDWRHPLFDPTCTIANRICHRPPLASGVHRRPPANFPAAVSTPEQGKEVQASTWRACFFYAPGAPGEENLGFLRFFEACPRGQNSDKKSTFWRPGSNSDKNFPIRGADKKPEISRFCGQAFCVIVRGPRMIFYDLNQDHLEGRRILTGLSFDRLTAGPSTSSNNSKPPRINLGHLQIPSQLTPPWAHNDVRVECAELRVTVENFESMSDRPPGVQQISTVAAAVSRPPRMTDLFNVKFQPVAFTQDTAHTAVHHYLEASW